MVEELDEFEKYLTSLEKTSLKDGKEIKSKANSVSINTALKKYRALKNEIQKQVVADWLETEEAALLYQEKEAEVLQITISENTIKADRAVCKAMATKLREGKMV